MLGETELWFRFRQAWLAFLHLNKVRQSQMTFRFKLQSPSQVWMVLMQIFSDCGPGRRYACETLAVMDLQRGHRTAENEPTTHKTRGTHRQWPWQSRKIFALFTVMVTVMDYLFQQHVTRENQQPIPTLFHPASQRRPSRLGWKAESSVTKLNTGNHWFYDRCCIAAQLHAVCALAGLAWCWPASSLAYANHVQRSCLDSWM